MSKLSHIERVKSAPGSDRVDFWHSFPKDDGWRRVTLESQLRHGFKLQPICNACQHRGDIFEIEEFSERYGVPMSMPVLLIQSQMVLIAQSRTVALQS